MPSSVDDVVKALNEVKEAAEKSARQAERMRKKLKSRAARGQWDRIGEGLDQIRTKMDVSEALKRAESHLAKAKAAVEEAATGAANTVKSSSAAKTVAKSTKAVVKAGANSPLGGQADKQSQAQLKPQAEMVPSNTTKRTSATKTAKPRRATTSTARKAQSPGEANTTNARVNAPRLNTGTASARKTSAAAQRPSTTRDKGKLN